MSMTKCDFEALARGLAKHKPAQLSGKLRDLWVDCVIATANVCAEANPAFNRDRFYDACNDEEAATTED